MYGASASVSALLLHTDNNHNPSHLFVDILTHNIQHCLPISQTWGCWAPWPRCWRRCPCRWGRSLAPWDSAWPSPAAAPPPPPCPPAGLLSPWTRVFTGLKEHLVLNMPGSASHLWWESTWPILCSALAWLLLCLVSTESSLEERCVTDRSR